MQRLFCKVNQKKSIIISTSTRIKQIFDIFFLKYYVRDNALFIFVIIENIFKIITL